MGDNDVKKIDRNALRRMLREHAGEHAMNGIDDAVISLDEANARLISLAGMTPKDKRQGFLKEAALIEIAIDRLRDRLAEDHPDDDV